MTDIESVSFLLGELRAGILQGNEDRLRLFSLIEKVDKEVEALREDFKNHIIEEQQLKVRLQIVEAKVAKSRTKVMIVIASISSGIVAGVAKLLGITSLGN